MKKVGQLTQRVHTLEMGNGAIQDQLNNVTKKLDGRGQLLAAVKKSLDRTLGQSDKE